MQWLCVDDKYSVAGSMAKCVTEEAIKQMHESASEQTNQPTNQPTERNDYRVAASGHLIILTVSVILFECSVLNQNKGLVTLTKK